MKTALLMDFTVDKMNHQIHVKREFAAAPDRVWAAWTEPELLDQWWAPRPYQTETHAMDFRSGGRWFYAMKGPEGDRHWCILDYETIDAGRQYSGWDAFCDEQQRVNEDFARSHWTNAFSASANGTLVNIQIQYKSLADLEKIVEMGFREGFMAAMENLDELFGT